MSRWLSNEETFTGWIRQPSWQSFCVGHHDGSLVQCGYRLYTFHYFMRQSHMPSA